MSKTGSSEFFADTLERFGDTPAILDDAGLPLSYAQLAAEADVFAQKIGATPQLIVICAANDRNTLIALLAALRWRHKAILTGMDRDAAQKLAQHFSAAFIIADGRVEPTGNTSPRCHQDLAIMLSTSGTTGSPKLVRLSRANVQANAESIASYLAISPADRPITTLPPHYSYGLSVLTSHLSAGAAIILNERSVIDAEFRATCERFGATSMAGVPHSYELLLRNGFLDWAPKTLTCLTQAGGRLSPDHVAKVNDWARGRGIRFFVMYGQTEATARMSYIPPDLLAENVGCIGQAIPGGRFELVDDAGQAVLADGAEGELVYHGANVMMGYAETPDALAAPPGSARLATGDLAVRTANGLYRLVGRKARFAKLFGLRVDLDRIEQMAAASGVQGFAVSDDQRLVLGHEGQLPADFVARLTKETGLPGHAFATIGFPDLPRRENGKPNYPAILKAGLAENEGAGSVPVLSLFQHMFPRAEFDETASFSGLGGDSLGYVNMSIALEDRIGHLPDDWEDMHIAELQALSETGQAIGHPGGMRRIATDTAIRACGIASVVANHASDMIVGGGVIALLMLTGFSFVRFQKQALIRGDIWPIWQRLLTTIILPSLAILAAYAFFVKPVNPSLWTFTANLDDGLHGFVEPFWFISAYVQIVLVITLPCLFVPRLRKFVRDQPYQAGVLVFAIALACRLIWPPPLDGEIGRRLQDVLLLVSLGWMLGCGRDKRRDMLSFALAFGLVIIDATATLARGWSPGVVVVHSLWIIVPTILLISYRSIALPALIVRVLGWVAIASFTIYLTHTFPIWTIGKAYGMPPGLWAAGLALALGVALHFSMRALAAKIRTWFALKSVIKPLSASQ